jgi:hypothetical protein
LCVDGWRHLLQVIEPDAMTIPAQVVKVEAGDQYPAVELKANSMSKSRPVVDLKPPIAVLVDNPRPGPTLTRSFGQ